jgi:large subunit ribosomal protein L10
LGSGGQTEEPRRKDLPTERKIASVEEMREWMASCTIAISADFTGMGVTAMTDLRRALREQGVHLQVVKNRLARIAAERAGREHIRDIVEGPTVLAYGFDEPTDPARALAGYIRANRPPLTIRGGVMGDRPLTAQEVNTLATLPGRDEMIARLASRIQSPIAALANVLQGPAGGLVRVLHQASQNMQTDAQ